MERWGGEKRAGGWSRTVGGKEGLRLKEFFFLKFGEARGLGEGKGLVGLDFTTDFWREAGNETANEEGRGNANDAVHDILKLRQVIGDCGFLGKLAKGSNGILVLRRRKPGLKRLDERRPRRELRVAGHPLKP